MASKVVSLFLATIMVSRRPAAWAVLSEEAVNGEPEGQRRAAASAYESTSVRFQSFKFGRSATRLGIGAMG
jgi:hypothetical protein